MRYIIFSLLFAAVLGAQAQQPGDWSSFRGNPLMTGVAKEALPAPLKQLWHYQTKSGVKSTAAIVGDTVYVGTKDGELLALALATGKLRWKFTAGAAISAAPCVVGSTVYVGDEDGIFHAVNRVTGKQLWKFKTGDKIISSARRLRESSSSALTTTRSIACTPPAGK